MKLEIGWEIACPDGRIRHFPYHNEGDALCDAEVYSERGCRAGGGAPTALEQRYPACPEGEHVVRPAAFLEPSTPDRSVA